MNNSKNDSDSINMLHSMLSVSTITGYTNNKSHDTKDVVNPNIYENMALSILNNILNELSLKQQSNKYDSKDWSIIGCFDESDQSNIFNGSASTTEHKSGNDIEEVINDNLFQNFSILT